MNPETERIKKYYKRLPERMEQVREIIDHPLTLSEKILYCHLLNRRKEKHT